jgi:undecaprenyl-diphosphatase
MGPDTQCYLRINGWARQSPAAHALLAGYALWGGLTLLAALLVGGWWLARHRGRTAPEAVATAVLTGAATVFALLVNQQLVSPAIARPRPCRVLDHVQVLLACSVDYSMPSDHCVIAGAFVAGLILLRRALGTVATLAALALAFSRVYVGVHYPSDTLVGLLIGAVIGAGIVLVARRPATGFARRIAATRWRGLVVAGPAPGCRGTGWLR